ncbi:MAG: hypothetical protein C0404_07665 [Verrucomicrobia bacterium]|nr:hypothetical protein [Verrucomicrobiota bacterium]
MIDQLRHILDKREIALISPLEGVPRGLFDTARTCTEVKGDFVLCKFVGVRDLNCPFELHFGRKKSAFRFNFFIGLGAEFHNYTDCSTPDNAADAIGDLELFLRSKVVCEMHSDAKRLRRVVYSLDKLVVEGVPVHLEYRTGTFWPLYRDVLTVKEYAQWLS